MHVSRSNPIERCNPGFQLGPFDARGRFWMVPIYVSTLQPNPPSRVYPANSNAR